MHAALITIATIAALIVLLMALCAVCAVIQGAHKGTPQPPDRRGK